MTKLFSQNKERIIVNFLRASTLRMIKSRRMRWAGHVTGLGQMRSAHRILVGKPEGTRTVRRLQRKWEDNNKIDVREIKWNGMDWIVLARNRDQRRDLVNTVMNLRVQYNFGKFLRSCVMVACLEGLS
jgi:hypothetical protein